MYISKEQKIAIEQELETLSKTDRPNVLELLNAARNLGDLSENAEYHDARQKQWRIEGRIAEIESILINSKIISENLGNESVNPGNKVVLLMDNKEKVVYSLGVDKEGALNISLESPVAKAILGKKKGDTTKLSLPKGEVSISISSIE